MSPILSLAIPTNGICEWVFPVLDSIYSQKVDESLFEVIVTDNGNNLNFNQLIHEYKKKYSNLIYKKTNSILFMNQIDAFKLCSGEFIKFVNHRSKFYPQSIHFLIKYVQDNLKEKPITFFSNGAIDIKNKMNYYSDFDSFVYGLSYLSSWSGGISCWKQDLNLALNNTIIKDQSLYPHLKFVFLNLKGRQYHIINNKLFDEIEAKAVKGSYDVFFAFGVEYIEIIQKLLELSYIDKITYNHVFKDNEEFLIKLYANYIILGKTCSYDLTTAEESLDRFYSFKRVRFLAWLNLFKIGRAHV